MQFDETAGLVRLAPQEALLLRLRNQATAFPISEVPHIISKVLLHRQGLVDFEPTAVYQTNADVQYAQSHKNLLLKIADKMIDQIVEYESMRGVDDIEHCLREQADE